MPLKSKVQRVELRSWHDQVEAKLSSRRLHIISYNVDGTEIERGLTNEIQQAAVQSGRVHTWTFTHPVRGSPDLVLQVPTLANKKPCIMGSDGKHAKKNSRGSATSGARVLPLGRFLVHYGQLARLAQGANSPLLKTDIIGVDKQDDRAAARLFSAAVIKYISSTMPEEIGLATYLFIIGELIDAQQNRNLTHAEWTCMLWRGKFFLEGWRQSVVDHPHYALHTHFITRELYDILSIYINAMLALIVAHRDFFPDCPLLLHLNSTEVCEHYFACGRKVKDQFNVVEWVEMQRKLELLMAGELKNNLNGAQEKASARQHGYHHSYFDSRGLDVVNLTTFPSDTEIEEMIELAHAEAQSLLEILGVKLPVVAVPDVAALAAALAKMSDDPLGPGDAQQTGDQEEVELSDAAKLELLLRMDGEDFNAGRIGSTKDDTPMTNLGIAATAAAIHDSLRMYVASLH